MRGTEVVSSGSVMADKRHEYAMQFLHRGDVTAAIDLLQQVVELVPLWAPAHFHLGEAIMAQTPLDNVAATAAFTRYLHLDASDTMGAIIKLNLLGTALTPPTLPPAYVETLFDQYAPHFEAALLEGLQYSTPRQLDKLIRQLWPATAAAPRVLDVGCGTGLMGDMLHGWAARLDGVDLSAGMVAQAEAKQVYHTLVVAELHDYLAELAAQGRAYELEAFMEGVQQLLAPGGMVAFSVQANAHEGDFVLGADHRYSHHLAYLTRLLAAYELTQLQMTPSTLRYDAGAAVKGWLVAAQKPRAAQATDVSALPARPSKTKKYL